MFCGACLPSDMVLNPGMKARLQSDYNTDHSLTRLSGRCDGKMIIWNAVPCRALLEPNAKCRFPHQIRRTTRLRLHGETMSTGVWRSGARPAWSVRWHSEGRVGPADTQQHAGNHGRR